MDMHRANVLLSGLPGGGCADLAQCASYSGPATEFKTSERPVPLPRGSFRACTLWGALAIFVEFTHGGARPGAGRPARQTVVPAHLDTLRWYCVRTDHKAENRADIEIRRAGFEVFKPSVWRPAEAMRRDRNGVTRPAKPDRVVPMFPRYLFTRFNVADPSWGQIAHLPGVDRLMGAAGGAGSPGVVSDEAIALLWTLLEPNGCAYPANHVHMNPFEPGTALRILSGGMEGQEGICEWSDGRRVRLLLHILGRPVPVTLSQRAVSTA